MVIFDSASIYLECATTLQDKITRLDAVIDALITMSVKAAETGNFDEYQLNDGQTIIRTKYRDVVAVANSIAAFRRIRQDFINELNGRSFRLVDGKNFTGQCR
jgi:hypothetical protein